MISLKFCWSRSIWWAKNHLFVVRLESLIDDGGAPALLPPPAGGEECERLSTGYQGRDQAQSSNEPRYLPLQRLPLEFSYRPDLTTPPRLLQIEEISANIYQEEERPGDGNMTEWIKDCKLASRWDQTRGHVQPSSPANLSVYK